MKQIPVINYPGLVMAGPWLTQAEGELMVATARVAAERGSTDAVAWLASDLEAFRTVLGVALATGATPPRDLN